MSRKVIEAMDRAFEKHGSDEALAQAFASHGPGRRNADGEVSLLHHAARHGRRETIDWLLRQDHCRRNAKDAEGLTPLDYAAMAGRAGIVAFLLEDPHNDTGEPLQYRNVHPGKYDGATTETRAKQNGADAVADLLRKHAARKARAALDAADPQAGLADRWGRTALHHAVTDEDWARAQRLMDLGADPRQADEIGESPVWYAVRARSLRGLNLFHRAGVDLLNERNAKGQTLTHIAAAVGSVPLLERLQDVYQERHPGRPVRLALDQQDNKGRTAAHAVAADGGKAAAQTARWLASNGAELMISTVDAHEDTPVSMALEWGNPEVARVFLAAISDVDLQYVWEDYLKLATASHIADTGGHGAAIVERILKAHRSFPPDPEALRQCCDQAKARVAYQKGRDETEHRDAEAMYRLIRAALDRHAPVPGARPAAAAAAAPEAGV